MEEVYTVKELAAIMNVPWQTVVAWRRHGQNPFGTFIKSIIDPMIEVFKRNTPATPDSNPTPAMSTQQEKSKTPAKKNYSAKVKKEAMRLIFEENKTLEQTAEAIGCSIGAVRQWKAKHHKAKKATSEAKKPTASPQQPLVGKTSAPKKSPLDFDEFARQYWQEGTRAVDVLLLPAEIGPKVVNYVNEALKFAFEKLR